MSQPTTEDTAPPALSEAQWAALSEDEPGELVDGRLVEEEMPDLTHETVVSWLVRILGMWLVPRGGFVFGSEAKFIVAARRGRKPDVTAYFPGRPTLPRRGAVRLPPDIAVEVVSLEARDVRRDRIDKLGEYAAFGIRYYWLIDPMQRTFEIFELGADGRYVRAFGSAEGRVEDVVGCPGLVLDLDELWAEVDRLGPESSEEQ